MSNRLKALLSPVCKFLFVVLIAAHVWFFVLEWWWLEFPYFRDLLGFKNDDQSEVAIVGKNQAFSNLVLAAGLVFSWRMLRRDAVTGKSTAIFFLASIFLAGLVGFFTILGDKRPFLALQTIPAALLIGILTIQPTVLIRSHQRADPVCQ